MALEVAVVADTADDEVVVRRLHLRAPGQVLLRRERIGQLDPIPDDAQLRRRGVVRAHGVLCRGGRIGHHGVGQPVHDPVHHTRERLEPVVQLDVPSPGDHDRRPRQGAGKSREDIRRVEPRVDDVVPAAAGGARELEGHPGASLLRLQHGFLPRGAYPDVVDPETSGSCAIVVLAMTRDGEEVDPEAVARQSLCQGKLLELRSAWHQAGDHVGDPERSHAAGGAVRMPGLSRLKASRARIMGSFSPRREAMTAYTSMPTTP